MKDSYERFFSQGHITKEQFFQFGLEETIYAPLEKATEAWELLKARISSNQKVYMRGFGRDGGGTNLFLKFYKDVIGHDNIQRDPTNNAEPSRTIAHLTGLSKKSSIRNYQISHVFGRTKNIYAFTAPWNIALIPKIIDPFTGHEAKGDLIKEYQTLFKQKTFKHFEPMINDFNQIVTNPAFCNGVKDYLDKISEDNGWKKAEASKIKKAIADEFSPIDTTSFKQ